MAGDKINIQKSIALPQINNVKRSPNFMYVMNVCVYIIYNLLVNAYNVPKTGINIL